MGIAIKSLIVTVLAALAAWLPMAILLTTGIDAELALPLAGRLFLLPIMGCAFVGLPVALFVFKNASDLTLSKLLIIANATGIVLAMVFAILGGGFAAFFYGLPTILAANAFAVFGWLVIVKPSMSQPDA